MAMKGKTRSQTQSAEAGSWTALLAATTLGDGAGTLHAEVKAEGLSEGAYRLVVQSYAKSARRLPGQDARPIGSLQREVTADELRRGVRVNLLELREACGNDVGLSPTVVAWIESGKPDLEFDGRKARPRAGSVYGIVKRRSPQDLVQINLDRRFAAA
jgi:hypothetical protein